MQKITKGNRNLSLYTRASNLKNDGATYEQIERTIRYMNRNMIEPPVSDGRIRALLKDVKTWFDKEAANAN